jgi:dihydroorotase
MNVPNGFMMTQQHWQLPAYPQHTKKTAYINARLIDPESGLDSTGALLTEGSNIADFGANLFSDGVPEGIEVIDCGGHVLAPGLIDLRVHFREPGQGHKETLATGSKSAAAGGITTVVCQPNTRPVIDEVSVIEYIKARARTTSYVNILTYAAISKGMKGEELSDMGKLVEAGVVGFSDGGQPVMNALLMRRALTYSTTLGVPICQHAEDMNLSQGGCMNEGDVSFKLGVTGIPNIAESVMVERDIAILELTGGHYHVPHVSTKESLEAIRRGKAKGLNITCEVAPHHFTLTDEAVLGYKTYAKMNPPLRSEADRLALIEGLRDNTIDAIASDHAPHDEESKRVPLSSASFGIVGLETMLPLALELYHQKLMPLGKVLAKMTCQAADIIRQPSGRLKKSAVADLVLIDIDTPWTIDIHAFSSKSHNSPFDGRNARGRAIRTIVGGETVYRLGNQ